VVAKRDGELPQQTDASQLTELVSRYLGPELIQGPPRWFSGAPFYMRVATQLQTRRSFIAGDAAHLFSPIGGTGMNTGMQDAFNLAWKLAYVLHDHAPESLLASYSEERLPAIHQAAAAADAATRLISRLETAPERIAPLLPSLHRRSLLRVLPIKQAGIDLQYGASSALSAEQRPGGLTVGSLCRGLLDLRKFGHSAENKLACQVLLFLTKSSRQAAVGEVAALARELSAYGPRPLVLSVVGLDDAGANPNVAALLRRMAASDGELVVVRPDGIIACAATLLDRRPLHALLARWFGKQPATLGSWSQSSTEA